MKISIITPSYQQGRFIERTIQSVLSQPIKDFEYWVMDGGSTDETLSILEKYSTQLKFISEKDRGQAHAVNKGLAKASGDIIAWLNSDDIYYPDTLKKVLDYFIAHPEVDVLYGNAVNIDENDKILSHYPAEPFNVKRLKQTCYLSQPATFFRRSCVERFGLLDESLNFCMDYEYWLRLAKAGAKFAYLPEVLSGSRCYAQTKTMSAPLRATDEALTMLKNKFGKAPLQWLINYSVCYARQRYQFKPAVYLMAFWKLAALMSS